MFLGVAIGATDPVQKDNDDYSIVDGRAISMRHSGYAGAAGMRRFLDCAGTEVTEVVRSPSKLSSSLPASVKDFIALGGRLKLFDGTFFRISIDNFKSLGETKYLAAFEHATKKAFAPEYDWTKSLEFKEQYGNRKNWDTSIYAGESWFVDFIFMGQVRDSEGFVYLLNPFVQSLDGEWEAWAGNHRYGNLRFASFAEMLGHVYLYSQRSSGDVVRFSREDFAGTCAAALMYQ